RPVEDRGEAPAHRHRQVAVWFVAHGAGALAAGRMITEPSRVSRAPGTGLPLRSTRMIPDVSAPLKSARRKSPSSEKRAPERLAPLKLTLRLPPRKARKLAPVKSAPDRSARSKPSMLSAQPWITVSRKLAPARRAPANRLQFSSAPSK